MAKINDIEQLFRNNYAYLLRISFGILNDEETAKDIVHDIFASLLTNNLKEITPSYLSLSVRNKSFTYLRDMSTRERLKNLYALSCQESEEEEFPNEATIGRINEIIDKELSMQSRKVVNLRFSDGLSYKEIASQLSISEVAVYKHLRHALDVLRKNFKVNG